MLSSEPASQILQRQEIGAHVLRRARNEAQDLRDAPQHRHLAGRRRVPPFFLPPRNRFSSAMTPARLVHPELAEASELDDLAGRHAADDGVAIVAPRLEIGRTAWM